MKSILLWTMLGMFLSLSACGGRVSFGQETMGEWCRSLKIITVEQSTAEWLLGNDPNLLEQIADDGTVKLTLFKRCPKE